MFKLNKHHFSKSKHNSSKLLKKICNIFLSMISLIIFLIHNFNVKSLFFKYLSPFYIDKIWLYFIYYTDNFIRVYYFVYLNTFLVYSLYLSRLKNIYLGSTLIILSWQTVFAARALAKGYIFQMFTLSPNHSIIQHPRNGTHSTYKNKHRRCREINTKRNGV